MRGNVEETGPTHKRPPESYIGYNKRLVITAFENSIVPIFDAIMPDPQIEYNPRTGLIVRTYVNS